jgi:hypothetical protein
MDELLKAEIEKIGHKRGFIRSLHLELVNPSMKIGLCVEVWKIGKDDLKAERPRHIPEKVMFNNFEQFARTSGRASTKATSLFS